MLLNQKFANNIFQASALSLDSASLPSSEQP
jgi:hypothetical protein